jgi:glycerophosphoryl diester phosphodiesterase
MNMNWNACFKERIKHCYTEDDQGPCAYYQDLGQTDYSNCTHQRDDGYKDCCGWIPCKWFCDAWVWIVNLVCDAWAWISNFVCAVYSVIKKLICFVTVSSTALICMIPGVGKYLTELLDQIVKTTLSIIIGVVMGVIDFISHPIESIETIISLFMGCPKARASDPGSLLVIAHHGSTIELPENTIQSCARALALGAKALEVDICLTSDGYPILWHDWAPDDLISLTRQIELGSGDSAFKPHVPKLGNEWRRPCIELTLAEFRDHYSYQDERDAVVAKKWEISHGKVDLTIPTLAEFLSAASEWDELRTLFLDVKMPGSVASQHGAELTDQIHNLIASRREPNFNVIVMVPNNQVLDAMKVRSDEQQYGLVFTWDVEFPAGVILNPKRYSAIDHATIAQFHNAAASVGRPVAALFPWRIYRRTIEYDIGRRDAVNADPSSENAGVRIDSLVAWTINDTDEMKCLAKMGVTGIITDKIADLIAVAASEGR